MKKLTDSISTSFGKSTNDGKALTVKKSLEVNVGSLPLRERSRLSEGNPNWPYSFDPHVYTSPVSAGKLKSEAKMHTCETD